MSPVVIAGFGADWLFQRQVGIHSTQVTTTGSVAIHATGRGGLPADSGTYLSIRNYQLYTRSAEVVLDVLFLLS
jgi:hypothetical protein